MSKNIQLRINQASNSARENNINSDELVKLLDDCIDHNLDHSISHELLDLAHLCSVSKSIANSNYQELWFNKLVQLIKKSNYHFGILLKQRADFYNEKNAITTIKNGQLQWISYSLLWEKIINAAKALSHFEKLSKPIVIGLLTNNQINGSLIDLACLSFGIKVVPIPLNSTSQHVSYIIDHAEITHLFIGGKTGLKLWSNIEAIHTINAISLDDSDFNRPGLTPWEEFLELADNINNFDIDARLMSVQIEDLQTIMYTSGTTANPKGIVFNQTHIISKRFARGLALPDIGSDDIFLSYLPLFHTFGRYLELMGSIYWGACYTFAESPAFNSLLNDFKLTRPTIFISIPKRWVQLYELIETKIDIDSEEDDKIKKLLNEITGGSLKWGLSAAGYLDPDIFSFFQHYKINLLSGYGMTEATGGITMTPPNDYKKDSVGKALPGIRLKLKKDGELYIRGPYVSLEYYKEKHSNSFKNGWFYTEDIFKENNGHYYIVDRKKDIYKNSRGQTIAPQKIENLFQDFDLVKSVFLVGDGLEFNTVLLYPNYDNFKIDINNIHEDEIRDIFSSMILSVNSFLSSYERIINYVVIQRDFSKENGELTHKGTYNRKIILKNFSKIITPLYEKNYLPLIFDSKEIRIPNWLLREIGVLKGTLTWDGNRLYTSDQSKSLIIKLSEDYVQIGDFIYDYKTDILDFESLIQYPPLWLGNISFTNFTGYSVFRLKESKEYKKLKIHTPHIQLNPSSEIIPEKIDSVLFDIHICVKLFLNNDLSVFKKLSIIVDKKPHNWSNVIVDTFMNYMDHPDPVFRINLIESLLPLLSGDLFNSMIHDAYIYQKSINPAEDLKLNIKRINDDHYQSIIKCLKRAKYEIKNYDSNEEDFIKVLLVLISNYGTIHPTRFVWARSEIISWLLSGVPKPIHSTAQKAYYNLIKGFRSWIGQSTKVTVDPETGEEYGWEDIIIFDGNVRKKHRTHLLNAIIETSLIKESIFLFSKNCLLELNDIEKDGLWVSHIESRDKKSIFRILIKTRTSGTHNITVNLNEGWNPEFIDEETKLLITMSSGFKDVPLVKNFGGYWPEYQLYTEEYIQGETLSSYLSRNKKDIKDKSKIDRWQMRWLHFMWNGIMAYQEFWHRTKYKFTIQPPNLQNLIIPKHDYKTGTKLITISGRKPIYSISEHFLSLYTDYIINTEQEYEGLRHMSDWELIFTATLQASKIIEGKKILNNLKSELKSNSLNKKCNAVGLTEERINQFLMDIDRFGVLTKPVVFASLRYERWLSLNQNATLNAKASILQELYNDYELDNLLDEYPETRVRFFMMTCFKGENINLTKEFESLIKALRKKELSPWNIQEKISEINLKIKLNDDEKFFLARMLFPHIDAADFVELVTTDHGDKARLDLVFQTECKDGELYRIRPPFLPKEIAQFHTLLTESSLSATFTSEHEFLFAFNSRNKLVGGLYWKNTEKNRIHLEWVVIRKKYQKISLSKRLMSDLYKRMKHKNIEIVTVGFYAEKFFFGHGFALNNSYGGLVKEL